MGSPLHAREGVRKFPRAECLISLCFFRLAPGAQLSTKGLFWTDARRSGTNQFCLYSAWCLGSCHAGLVQGLHVGRQNWQCKLQEDIYIYACAVGSIDLSRTGPLRASRAVVQKRSQQQAALDLFCPVNTFCW